MNTNLRGRIVDFSLPGYTRVFKGLVITRTRGTRWLVQCNSLPKRYWRANDVNRIVLDEAQFVVRP